VKVAILQEKSVNIWTTGTVGVTFANCNSNNVMSVVRSGGFSVAGSMQRTVTVHVLPVRLSCGTVLIHCVSHIIRQPELSLLLTSKYLNVLILKVHFYVFVEENCAACSRLGARRKKVINVYDAHMHTCPATRWPR